MLLLIGIMNQMGHVLLVPEDLLILDMQLIEVVENGLKYRRTHRTRSGLARSASSRRANDRIRSSALSSWTAS